MANARIALLLQQRNAGADCFTIIGVPFTSDPKQALGAKQAAKKKYSKFPVPVKLSKLHEKWEICNKNRGALPLGVVIQIGTRPIISGYTVK